jgi:hypothetical protein
MTESFRPALASQVSRWMKSAVSVFAVSSVIALLLASMSDGDAHLPQTLVISYCIGCCIWLLFEVMHAMGRERIGIVSSFLIAVPVGVVLGGKLATLFGAVDMIGAWVHDPAGQWRSIGGILLFALSASVFNIVFWRAADDRVALANERRRSAEIGRSQAVAELGLLQAQIEPHFLFNTLAHVQSAIEEEPAVGKAMLEYLIRYLRSTLNRSRVLTYTLAEELDLVESVLAIAAIRLGARLRYEVESEADLNTAALPPLLLQPLVENAIKHGIEASVDGGEIRVQCRRSGVQLSLRVIDSGVGIAAAAPEGIGLSNVRARLASLYGEEGRLTLLRNEPRGMIAELLLPLRVASRQ